MVRDVDMELYYENRCLRSDAPRPGLGRCFGFDPPKRAYSSGNSFKHLAANYMNTFKLCEVMLQ